MAYNLKQTLNKEERLSPGHRMCAGCGATIAVRNVLRGLHEEDEAVITCATGCLEVSSFMYPYTAWKDSFIHNAFENAGATCSGVEAAYRALKKKGKVKKETKNPSVLTIPDRFTIFACKFIGRCFQKILRSPIRQTDCPIPGGYGQ